MREALCLFDTVLGRERDWPTRTAGLSPLARRRAQQRPLLSLALSVALAAHRLSISYSNLRSPIVPYLLPPPAPPAFFRQILRRGPRRPPTRPPCPLPARKRRAQLRQEYRPATGALPWPARSSPRARLLSRTHAPHDHILCLSGREPLHRAAAQAFPQPWILHTRSGVALGGVDPITPPALPLLDRRQSSSRFATEAAPSRCVMGLRRPPSCAPAPTRPAFALPLLHASRRRALTRIDSAGLRARFAVCLASDPTIATTSIGHDTDASTQEREA